MSFGKRLRAERERLGLNQDRFAEVCGVRRRAQSSYENDERHPDAQYLAAAANAGVNVGYLLTARGLTADQRSTWSIEPEDFARAVMEILGITDTAILEAEEELNRRMARYALDILDAAGTPAQDSMFAIHALETRNVVKTLLDEIITRPNDLDSELLSAILDSIDRICRINGYQLGANKKASVAAVLYRSSAPTGHVDPKLVADTLRLAQ